MHALTARLEAVREEERTRLSREVHDQLGQSLTALTLDFAWLDKRFSRISDLELRQSLQDKIADISRQVDQMIKTVQEISSQLRPSVLDNLGLSAAIRFEVNRFAERSGVKCELTLSGDFAEQSSDRSTAIFRILQEILTNIARHAKASMVRIATSKTDSWLTLRVEDNGVGITPEQVRSPHSLGLLGIRERTKQLNGDIQIVGKPGQGTCVTLRVP